MRLLLCALTMFARVAAAEIVAEGPQESPSSVAVKSNELAVKLGATSIVRFVLSGQRVVRVDITVAGKRYIADMRTCALPASIHTNNMVLLRDDLRDDTHRRDGFTLLFDVGSENDRKFGELPRIQLTWEHSRLEAAYISHMIAANSGFGEPLCNPDVQPNYAFERSRDE
jgi:hypothetical protein